MFDIADALCLFSGLSLPLLEQRFQPRLAVAQRQAAQVHAIGKQQIESIEDQSVGLAVGNGGLQRRKIRRAVVVKCNDLPVDQHIC